MQLKDIDVAGYETLIIDRDGTINVHILDGYVTRWEEFQFLPGAVDAIARFARTAKHIFVVTNQRGISKGLYTEADLNYIHEQMVKAIEAAGGHIDGIYWCSGPEGDTRRKPAPGMFHDICSDFPDVDPETTVMIGDGDVDRDFAENCKIDFIRID